MVYREERLFFPDILPTDPNFREFFLRFVNKDENGIKFTGDIPPLWDIDETCSGPVIVDDDYNYRVTKVDYDNQYIRLEQLE